MRCAFEGGAALSGIQLIFQRSVEPLHEQAALEAGLAGGGWIDCRGHLGLLQPHRGANQARGEAEGSHVVEGDSAAGGPGELYPKVV